MKITKKSFVEHALAEGLYLVGSLRGRELKEVIDLLDAKKDNILASAKKDRVTGNASCLLRHGERVSRLTLGAGDEVYKHGPFYLIHNHDNIVIYT